MFDDAPDLQELANRIRRDPRLAQVMDVSALVGQVVGRWRQYNDLLEASEEVPLAAWIVRRKVEGLVRPELPEPELLTFDRDQRALWPSRGAELLKIQQSQAERFLPRSAGVSFPRLPAPVKEASVWKLVWSFPRLRPPKKLPFAVVKPQVAPLQEHMQSWLTRLDQQNQVVFQEELAHFPRRKWPVYFLAAVHLWHDQAVYLSQAHAFDHLVLQKASREQACDGPSCS